MAGLFPSKIAATIFNNKIELFEKDRGFFKCKTHQNTSVGLGVLRFLGYERPPETLN